MEAGEAVVAAIQASPALVKLLLDAAEKIGVADIVR